MQPWTTTTTNELRELVELGCSFSEIGRAMGRSRESCIGRAWRAGIKGPGSRAPAKPARAAADDGLAKINDLDPIVFINGRGWVNATYENSQAYRDAVARANDPQSASYRYLTQNDQRERAEGIA